MFYLIIFSELNKIYLSFCKNDSTKYSESHDVMILTYIETPFSPQTLQFTVVFVLYNSIQ